MVMRDHILKDLKQARCYSIQCDETKDLSKKEQLSIVFRYIASSGDIRETFFSFSHANLLDANSLTNIIFGILDQYEVDPRMCVSQCYDGASVMSGHLAGVNILFRERKTSCYIYPLFFAQI